MHVHAVSLQVFCPECREEIGLAPADYLLHMIAKHWELITVIHVAIDSGEDAVLALVDELTAKRAQREQAHS